MITDLFLKIFLDKKLNKFYLKIEQGDCISGSISWCELRRS